MARGRSISNLHIDFQILEGTYAEFDGHGEVVDASLLGNSFTAGDTWKVDVGRFDYAFFYAIESVAEPAPSLAFTTSSPPNCTPASSNQF